jgi:hypothetical protein
MNPRNRILTGAVLAAVVTLGAACDSMSKSANQVEGQAQGDAASRFLAAQPIPQRAWSQYRQTLIDAETAQMDGTQTTSFWFSRGASGAGTPIGSCPSLGFPVPASAQLSNPLQALWGSNGASTSIGQMEPNGVYSGTTDGTYVVCAGTGGKPYLTYVEADVVTIGGPAEFRDGKVQPTGDPTIKPGVKK